MKFLENELIEAYFRNCQKEESHREVQLLLFFSQLIEPT